MCVRMVDSQRYQRRQRAPQPLLGGSGRSPFWEALGTAPATRKTASGTSSDNAGRSPFWEALGAAPATKKTASGTSSDNPGRSPFWRLWVLRLPRGRQPAATTRAAVPSERLWVLRLPPATTGWLLRGICFPPASQLNRACQLVWSTQPVIDQ